MLNSHINKTNEYKILKMDRGCYTISGGERLKS